MVDVSGQARAIGVAERRARLARRHRLARVDRVDSPLEVARSIVAYHATDPASVYLAMAARTGPAASEAMDKALYDDRTLVRILGMRRTMFVVPTELMPVVHQACTDSIAVTERRRTLRMISEGGVADDAEAWLDRVQDATVRALRARGEATTRELSDDVPELRAQIVLAPGKKYEATATMAPRVLFQLSAQGLVVRGRPVKSWVSNYRWALTETWLPAGVPEVSVVEAELELARRWLAAFGPGTVADLKWWTGWTLGRARRVLAALGAVEVALDGGETGYVLPDDAVPVSEPEPWPALLPALDPAVMGWAMTGRGWYLGDDCRDALYDRNGNIGPTVWWDGRVVGGWAQRADGNVVHRLLEDIGTDGEQAVARQAEDLQEWLGDVRVTPRFRTPLERELSA
ncbi:MAG TPA: winged helix DNA-binding domain-containing protein [Jiangellaceae bacterium]|nr:winged helix DNA-binding domain-containing protein [Jiangellaceae bacterium]